MSIVDLERESLTGINSRQAAPLDGAAGGGLYSADLGLLIIFQANSFDQAQLGFQPVDVLFFCFENVFTDFTAAVVARGLAERNRFFQCR